MLQYFISLVKHLPDIKSLEYRLTKKAYWLGSPDSLKDAFLGQGDPTRESYKIPKFTNELVNTFRKMPLSLQMKHIFNINYYQDECTYLEDYKISSSACQAVLTNQIMMSYAEVILLQLDKDKKVEFLEELYKNIRKGGFMGAKYHEEDQLILIEKWKLENELTINLNSRNKKVVKL